LGAAYSATFVSGDSLLTVDQTGVWTMLAQSGESRLIANSDAALAAAFDRSHGTSYIVTRAGRLFSYEHSTGTLTELAQSTLELLDVVVDEAARLLYVGSDRSLEVFDIPTGQFVRSVFTGVVALHMALAPDRTKLYLSGDGHLVELNLVTTEQRELAQAQGIALTANGATLYAVGTVDPYILAITTATGETRTVVTLPCEGWGLGLTPDETQLYASCLTRGRIEIIDIDQGKVVKEHRSLGSATRVAFSPDGLTAAIGTGGGVALVR
jgi:DNA-binding beta-propeller fold protein YncE